MSVKLITVPRHIFEVKIPDIIPPLEIMWTRGDAPPRPPSEIGFRELTSRYNFETRSFTPVTLSDGTIIQPIHETKTGPSEHK